MFYKSMVIPVRFGFHITRPPIQRLDGLFNIQILCARQSFCTEQVNPCDVHLLKLVWWQC